MKAICIIIKLLIVFVPFFMQVICIALVNPAKSPFVGIWLTILTLYLLLEFGRLSIIFENWFNSKLK